MKPLRVKKTKPKQKQFTCMVEQELFTNANVARAKLGLTWPFVVSAAMKQLVHEHNVVAKGKRK